MDTDRNLLFGVLALQADFLDAIQFAEACTAWAARKEVPLADLLVERGWLTAADKADIERLLQRKLRKHGDVRASLAAAADDEVRRVLAVLTDSEIQCSLAQLSAAGEHVLLSTVTQTPERRERYTLTRLHASGGIGRVWLARDEDLGREVALKELRPETVRQPRLWGRFLEEAKITGQLEHPGIVPVYELARRGPEEQPFYTMRFVKGRTLTEAVRAHHQQRAAEQGNPLERRALLSAFVGVCQAVAYAHSRGVIHRDLKGQNVVLGDYGEVIVLDWGLAKPLSQSTGGADTPPVVLSGEGEREGTVQGQVLGTPAYMAPEQAEGRLDLFDARTDIYGLGAMLYEILTGRPPFAGSDTHDVLRKVREEEPARPRQVCAQTPPALEAVCLRALAKKRDQRYATAGELAQEVQRWLADEPVEAYRDPLLTRAGRWARRHKPLVAAAAALLVTAVVMLTISTVLIGKQKALVEAERNRAAENFRLARQAVDEYFTNVSQSEELIAHNLEPLRKKLLQSARGFYEKFVQQQSDDPGLQADLGRACYRLALLTSEIDARPRAAALFQESATIFERLLAGQPAAASLQRDLAAAYANLGVTHQALGESARAEDASTRAVTLLDQLVQSHPGEAQYQQDLALSYQQRGELCKALGQWDRAEEAYRQALSLLEQLVRQHPGVPRYRRDLAASHGRLGGLYHDTKKLPQALRAYEQVQHALAELLRIHPHVPLYQSDLALAFVNEAILQQTMSRLTQAEEAFRQALPLLEKLTREHPHILDYQRNLALTQINLSLLYQRQGQLDQAVKAAELAIAVLDKLAADHPSVPEYRSKLAGCRHQLGNLHKNQGNLARAEEVLGQALPLLDELVRAYPRIPEYQVSLAACQSDLAIVYAETGKFQPAEQGYRRAAEIFDKLAADSTEVLQYHRGRAINLNNLGNLYAATGKAAEADEVYRLALVIAERLTREQPEHAQLALELGLTYGNVGELRVKQGQPEEALNWYARSIHTLEGVRQREPGFVLARYSLGRAHSGKAEALSRLDRHGEAIEAWDKAIELVEGPPAEQARLARAVARARLGQHARAREEAALLASKVPLPGTMLYHLACVYARCTESAAKDPRLSEGERGKLAEQDAARAVELLNQAQAAGYFKDASLREYLKRDPDLAPLWSREDYRNFLKRLER
jgi:serine/threonine-protein kinase